MKKLFTKLLTVVLCLVLGLSVVACSQNSGNSSSSQAQSSSQDNASQEQSSSQPQSSSQEQSSSSQRASYSWTPSTEQQIGGGDGVKETTLFFVGDSTVCNYNNEANRYFPRNGYGMRVGEYLNDKVTIQNLALSGRSSKSFTTENNYQTLLNSIKEGDYLIIGFGHNDQKTSGGLYTDAVGEVIHEGSFKYCLYNYYIKVALDKGATPILCTPIVRRSPTNDYSGERAHIVAANPNYEFGNYPEAIRELGQEFGITVIDLTELTKTLYSSMTADETKLLHSTNAQNSESLLSPDNAIDNTHLNAYGASVVAHMLVTELNKTDNTLKNYIDADKLAIEPNVSMLELDENVNPAPAQ